MLKKLVCGVKSFIVAVGKKTTKHCLEMPNSSKINPESNFRLPNVFCQNILTEFAKVFLG